MFQNNNQSSLLGLSYTLPSNMSNKPILSAPPGLIHPSLMNHSNHNSTSYSNSYSMNEIQNLYQVETKKLSAHDLFLNEDLMISNEIIKLSSIYETLINKKSEIDRHLIEVHTHINELVKRKEHNKRNMSISTHYPTLSEATGIVGEIPIVNTKHVAFKETVSVHTPLSVKPNVETNEVSESFIKSVQDILTKYPNIQAREIQNKLSSEHKPPPGSRKFQSMLFKVPGVMSKEEKIITKNGTGMIENIFFLDNGFDKKIIVENKKPVLDISSSSWRGLPIKEQSNFTSIGSSKSRERQCFRKIKGKSCKINEKGFCNYCN
jgi:hypothetical protein